MQLLIALAVLAFSLLLGLVACVFSERLYRWLDGVISYLDNKDY